MNYFREHQTIFEHFPKSPYILHVKKKIPAGTKIDLTSDPELNFIIKETNRIYSLYAVGRISKETALKRLSDFLDSKGKTESGLIALASVKTWRR